MGWEPTPSDDGICDCGDPFVKCSDSDCDESFCIECDEGTQIGEQYICPNCPVPEDDQE